MSKTAEELVCEHDALVHKLSRDYEAFARSVQYSYGNSDCVFPEKVKSQLDEFQKLLNRCQYDVDRLLNFNSKQIIDELTDGGE